MSWTSSRMSRTTIRPERWSRRQVDLGDVAGDDHARVEAEPGEEHLHLLGAGVLRLVEDHEGVVEGAAAHEGERRDLDHAALEVAVDPVGVEHVVERVEERPQVGVDLGLDVAGQEAEPLAGLDRGPGEDDPLHLAFGQRRGGHRHREEGLAGAGGADAEGDRVAADRVDVALLVERLRRDLGVAVAPDDVVEDLGRALVRRRARRSPLRSSPGRPRAPARSARPARRRRSPPSARRRRRRRG